MNGRFHDTGSLNGYAFTFVPSTAVRFWPWPTADQAAAVKWHPDRRGNLDQFVGFDVVLTESQAARIERWWTDTEAKMADPDNRL